jgi:hypothetical protein
MVRWLPLPDDLPEPVADFKRALRRAINDAGYANLGRLVQKTGIPDSTLSNAASGSSMPIKETLSKILGACPGARVGDSRYEGWSDLYTRACAAATIVTVLDAATPHSTPTLDAESSQRESPAAAPVLRLRRIRTTRSLTETVELIAYTDEQAYQLVEIYKLDSKPESKDMENGSD